MTNIPTKVGAVCEVGSACGWVCSFSRPERFLDRNWLVRWLEAFVRVKAFRLLCFVILSAGLAGAGRRHVCCLDCDIHHDWMDLGDSVELALLLSEAVRSSGAVSH